MSKCHTLVEAEQNQRWKIEVSGSYYEVNSDQCLNFKTHHAIENELSVVRTLLECSQKLSTEDCIRHEDRRIEDVL